jgi:hypothetical protein
MLDKREYALIINESVADCRHDRPCIGYFVFRWKWFTFVPVLPFQKNDFKQHQEG